MKESAETGGTKRFVYNKSDYKRIEEEDTESSLAFKKEYRLMKKYPALFWIKHNWLLFLIIVIAGLILLGIGLLSQK